MRIILSMMLIYISFLNADFTRDVSTNVVTDSTTTLEWQDNNESNMTQRTWQEAIDYCEALNLAGSNDWRLANINELKTLIDRTRNDISISNAFKYTGSNNVNLYWTSSTAFDHIKNKSWIIDFSKGSITGKLKTEKAYVRCVKDQ